MPPYLRSYFEAQDLDDLFAIAESERILWVTEQRRQAFIIRFQDATITLNRRQAISFVRGILWEYTLTGARIPQIMPDAGAATYARNPRR